MWGKYKKLKKEVKRLYALHKDNGVRMYSMKEIARMAKVDPYTVKRWVSEPNLPI